MKKDTSSDFCEICLDVEFFTVLIHQVLIRLILLLVNNFTAVLATLQTSVRNWSENVSYSLLIVPGVRPFIQFYCSLSWSIVALFMLR
ncbi:hypothetical protein DICVIV_00035 [Dictyocaulus viviparus]|uniref:Uncharacterized protein n=1 Tax=Dictyocaulus viviparus TaxID=29172 RepID=A0A0D8YBM1_DICVI|nr:hypothetical protein DICVIV_00035 [Dictyocaulus viviparus]